ncbi:hypothetical protein CASFOL_011470 [Castilleja foliolosa]|uniref:Fungal lipase-type domain-containing protein n=1 Tax=Castilleja foliolosa TaxID=1961234 RepID=A0ABD3DVK8_9LAMI
MDPNYQTSITNFLSKPKEARIDETDKVNGSIVESGYVFLLSKLAQKALRYNEKPMSMFGSGFEMCLNVFGNKRNFRLFVNNLLRGKVVVPSKESARFISTVGHLDNRVDLDKNIKPDQCNKYFASLAAMASKLAYENNEFIRLTVEERWKMELLGAYNFRDEKYRGYTTQAFMFQDKNAYPNTIFVAFRGTEIFSASDWITDIDIQWYKSHNTKGKIHGGFIKALGLKPDMTNTKTDKHQDAYDTILKDLKSHFETNHITKFVLTGHSLGGALAVLFPAILAMHNEIATLERLEAIYTFGQPRVGDEEFVMFMKEQFEHYGVMYYRFVYSHDIVPRLPYDDSVMMFKHFGTCLYIDSLYEAKIVEDEPMKNYFEWGAIVSKRVDALWELVRSFLLARMFGQEYDEGLLLRMFRMTGLLCPGLPAHGIQDYINATRLATY